MRTVAEDRRGRYAGFFLAMAAIHFIDGLLMRSSIAGQGQGQRTFVAAGATFDVVVVVSALYYWMLVRPGIRARGFTIHRRGGQADFRSARAQGDDRGGGAAGSAGLELRSTQRGHAKCVHRIDRLLLSDGVQKFRTRPLHGLRTGPLSALNE